MNDEDDVEIVEEQAIENIEPKKKEKMLSVERVNEIVKKEKLIAAEKARQEVVAEYAKKMEAEELQEQESQGQNMRELPSIGGMQSFDPSDIKAQIMQQLAEEAQEERYKNEVLELVQTFSSKMDAGKDLYPDFDDVTADFNPASFPQLVVLAGKMDNAADVMYELAKNPQKLANIDYFAQRDPKLAKSMLSKLSDSIAQNQEAANKARNTSAPLSRIKSSTVGADNGAMAIRDYKKASWLRG